MDVRWVLNKRNFLKNLILFIFFFLDGIQINILQYQDKLTHSIIHDEDEIIKQEGDKNDPKKWSKLRKSTILTILTISAPLGTIGIS